MNRENEYVTRVCAVFDLIIARDPMQNMKLGGLLLLLKSSLIEITEFG